MEKVVIVGTGPAGLTAALYTARAGLEPLVLEGLQPGGQLTTTTEVENFPGFSEAVDGTQLIMLMRGQAERFGARFLAQEVVGSTLRPLRHELKLSDDSTLETASLIIATGAAAKYLGIESERKLMGRGVSACATCDGAFYRNLRVAVVGGGDTAMEEALFLTRLCSHVTVIHRRDALRASKIMAERATANKKISFVWDSVVDEVLDVEKNEVTGVRVRNVKTGELSVIDVEGLFLGIGHQPNTAAFSGQVETDDNGFIKTNQTRTNIPGVFAAGDVQDPHYKQAVTAAGFGCMAALETERYLEAIGQ